MIKYNTDGYTINLTYVVTYKWGQATHGGFTWARFNNSVRVVKIAFVLRAQGLRKSARPLPFLVAPGIGRAFACLGRSLHLRAFAWLE